MPWKASIASPHVTWSSTGLDCLLPLALMHCPGESFKASVFQSVQRAIYNRAPVSINEARQGKCIASSQQLVAIITTSMTINMDPTSHRLRVAHFPLRTIDR